ncbi:CYTH domain protein [Caulifigura coniformis]|uniref:CYTH domain protein n=1 Tax=Caulifigura coniformis TaxID=2527983 RepID=A0A517S8J5_9PLAN|nr:class IV adenylate cyclase [Caulifigura coniformis]QDT52447.1 CYTH domain protein [Caulifigura coniformis]
MIEVELKYRLDEPESLLASLIARGAQPGAPTVERDLYFNHPARDFRQTDEALRLRWDGSQATLTYKGQLLDRVSKSREELELDLSPETGLETARRILGLLGFVESGDVEKQRTKFPMLDRGLPVLVTIDEVTGLGLFVELEASAERDSYEAARDRLLELAGELGLTQGERRSYLQLLVEQGAV